MLVDAGANIESESSYKTRPRPLHAAIGYPEMPGEREKIACLLMERGANILALDSYGHTPLHMAAFVGFSEVVRKLLAMGANVEAQSAWQRTPLHLCYSIASFHLIIDHGAKLEAQDKRGFTPLHRAVECLNYRVAQALLAAGASPNIRARHDSRTVWDRVEDIANEDERTRFFFLLQMPPSWRKKGSEDGFEIIGRAEAVE